MRGGQQTRKAGFFVQSMRRDRLESRGFCDPTQETYDPRMSQVLNLLNLSPRVQQALLLGKIDLSERRIRKLAGSADRQGI